MLKRLSLRYKIGFIAFVGFIGFFVYQVASYRLSLEISEKLQNIVSDELPVLQFSNRIQVNFSELNKLYQASLAEADPETLDEARQKALNIRLEFEVLQKRFNLDNQQFKELYEKFNAYVEKTSLHTAAVLENRLDYDEILRGYNEVSVLREEYLEKQKLFLSYRYQSFESKLYQIEEEERFLVRFGLILGILLTLILGVVSLVIIRRILATINRAVHVAEDIASGMLDEEIQIISEDETGKLMTSLNTMRDALKQQHEANAHREKEQGFMAGLNEAMRGDKTVEDLSEAVAGYFAEAFHAQVTALYMLSDGNLHRIAGVNYPKLAADIFHLNETSIYSDVTDSKKNLLTTSLPKHYLNSSNSYGPDVKWLVLYPVLHEGRFLALIEVAAFRRLGDDDIRLLNRSNNAIAISIASSQSRLKMSSMLEQTQRQAHTLNVQREELYQINDQLEEKNTELDYQQKQILVKNDELEESRKELLEQSAALEISGRYKSQFLSTMSHELRTPLNSILILSRALEENKAHHLNDKEVEHAKIIHNAGSDLLALINDILDLSKVEEGKMDVIIDKVGISDLAESWLYQFEFIAKEKGLKFIVNVDSKLPQFFFTDKNRLNQVVKNFISNALKFTESGCVSVDFSYPNDSYQGEMAINNQEEFVYITVSDTGLGIDKSKQAVVFEAFKQADGTTSRKFGGTGLGLTISKELASLLGGEITLLSDGLGRGSAFSLLIPIGNENDVEVLLKPARPQLFSEYSEGVSHYPIFDQVDIPLQVLSGDLLFFGESDSLNKLYQKLAPEVQQYIKPCKAIADLQSYLAVKTPVLIFTAGELLEEVLAEGFIDGSTPIYYCSSYEVKEDSLPSFVRSVGCESDESWSELFFDILLGKSERHQKILFVEDNPVFYPVINSLFGQKQLSVSIAEDALHALNLLLNQQYDYLVVDLNLPDYSGFDLIKAIRSLSSYNNKKIILFTAEDLMHKERVELLHYVDDVVFKSPQAIAEICNDALDVMQDNSRLRFSGKNFSHSVNRKDYQVGMLKDYVVLLVDDDERNLYSISSVLESEGLLVQTATSGKKALDCLRKDKSIQLVLLDIMMPEMDGFEVLEIIRHEADICHLPVIALTAKAMLGDREACLDAGASDYLSKPVNVDELLSIIATYAFHNDDVS